ncbi:hypothetical protein BHM03_00055001 [Ensete ventricosum]|uniref:Uncharacterized protein n=1 Tax=Ensete ventricosum TaxID=4639 RepID=A0A445MM73_ENSVE|nr:hypothetical protein BHM03_00055001 [Ensete ventricosum]
MLQPEQKIEDSAKGEKVQRMYIRVFRVLFILCTASSGLAAYRTPKIGLVWRPWRWWRWWDWGKASFRGGRAQDEAPRLKVSNPGCRFLCRRPSGHRVKRGGRRGPAAYDCIPGFPADPHVPRPRPHLRLCCGGTVCSLMVMPGPPP